MIKDKLKDAVKEAMKAKDKTRMETIRGILASIQLVEISKGVEPLPDDEVITILKQETKKRKEEIEFAEKAGRNETIEKSLLEISIVEMFLPQQISVEQLEKIIEDLKAETPDLNMGAAMKILKDKYAGQYDGKAASEAAKKILSK